ncbi:choline dehydrogenase [Fischerella thermalis CCMEE 5273]|uniref:GMC family oxidoreductase n=2 Tax=Fischerella thermalis TaxID=372787 RepID=UPI000C80D386|nr:choline dehydrogenase [Fischerella thermalis]PMB11782.1 choline dehydrogenase [Fischerella thermalis CCMEE 5273]PLZ04665.1 choline dehydrogenase [Fischerella thermalis WC119]PLZ06014.1 choline dehydrogenase [Fischerella thermalis WC114]PLZ24717.1 choline dehydrogenase [Fischerella thermalis WC157]PLZ28541.1 choline dehydrogenase [Fischerella thermalis WC559]
MYDYVIIGAGSAGCVLAHRLTENPKTTVLLLEAGNPDQKPEIHIPAGFPKLLKTEYDWAYYTEKQPFLNNRQLYWPRGKVIGGSSSINAMIYIRGNLSDYDYWHNLGNSGWSAKDVLPYFIKAENQNVLKNEYHGVDGLLNVTNQRCINPLSRAFVKAAQQADLPLNPDFNGAKQEGLGFYQVTQKNGKRHSVAAAYLKPILQRPNLTVQTNAQVTKINFLGTQAIGLTYIHQGVNHEIKIAKEVILSGGAINSPQLLMLSGIGDAEQLKSLGIPVVMNLPGVGKNLQDHLCVPVAYTCTKSVSLANAEKFINVLKYLLFKNGPLTTNVAEAGGFVKINPDSQLNELQFHFAPTYFLNHGFTRPEGHGFTFGPTLLYPQSKGNITLRSTNPSEAPVIQPNYLEKAADLEVLVAGVKLSRQLAQMPAFDSFRGEEFVPGVGVQDDEEIRTYIRDTVESLYHPVGTCKMGNDSMAVVNSQLQVHGVQGLRVIDASIMPSITGGNTNAPTIMIAEKAADMIKNY